MAGALIAIVGGSKNPCLSGNAVAPRRKQKKWSSTRSGGMSLARPLKAGNEEEYLSSRRVSDD
jgi:hypothetical protein